MTMIWRKNKNPCWRSTLLCVFILSARSVSGFVQNSGIMHSSSLVAQSVEGQSQQQLVVLRSDAYGEYDGRTTSRQQATRVQPIVGQAMFERALNEHTDEVTIIRFHAPYCRPCRMLGKKLLEMEQNTCAGLPVVFLEVNVNDYENESLVKKLGIRRVPTVHMYCKGGKAEDFTWKPPNMEMVEQKLGQLLGKIGQAQRKQQSRPTIHQRKSSHINVAADDGGLFVY
mmetsp:Transcript_7650/g.13307  ORF Transcript_7650/g.13307 Transcript_7650/m.13307 type:complete len:227 (-) Transcript_7650:32-712(-)